MFEYEFLKGYEGKKVFCNLEYGQVAFGVLTKVEKDTADCVWLHITFRDDRKISFLSRQLRAIREEK